MPIKVSELRVKICSMCKKSKPVSDYQKDPYHSNGLSPRCKECYKGWWDKNKHRFFKKMQEYSKDYYKKNKKRIIARCTKYYKERIKTDLGRKKINAVRLVRYHKMVGNLPTGMACSKCGKPKAEAHHEDYDKPLEVIWLCSSCHRRKHFGIEYVG